MLGVLTDFIDELRSSGLPISLTEAIDAAECLRHVPLGDRRDVRAALCATLVKSSAHLPAFDTAFDVYFSPRATASRSSDVVTDADAPPAAVPELAGTDGTDVVSAEDLAALLRRALATGDRQVIADVARLAVARFAGIEPGRPVGISYYLYRTLRGLDLEGALAFLRQAGLPALEGELVALERLGTLGERLRAEEHDRRAEELRRLVEAEIRRRLVDERGANAVAKSLRRPLVEDVDFMHATGAELAAMRRALVPLARALATRLARRRRHRRRGPLDFRATIHRSLSYGGSPLELRYRAPRLAKPELIVIADVSGSVASFARFTLHLVYALAAEFSKVRSFAFVDGIAEITEIFRRSDSIAEAIERVGREAEVTQFEGHSDYGNALSEFHDRHAREVTSRTTVIVLGDARNNYHAPAEWALEDLRRRARHLYWLNPEPQAYWGSGDSIMERYARHCDRVFECRNLRQLEAFVDYLA